MDIVKQKRAAEQFVKDWDGRGDEKQDTQNYWNQLLRTVYGVDTPEQYISYEKAVAKGFIDGYIADTLVLIEQKGMAFDLDAKEPRQGKMVTPYEQARDYVSQLPLKEKPRYIVTCNFQKIRIYDCNIQPSYDRKTDTWKQPYEEIELKDLPAEYRRLNFLVNVEDQNIKKEMEVSIQAGELVGIIYDELLKQYKDPGDPEVMKSLNQLCVRFVFCFYAEDAGIFGKAAMFHDYLQAHRDQARDALIKLFKVLDTKPEDRDPYEDEDLLAFPYVNGGIFENENIIIPRLTPEIVDLILRKASEDFDWSKISPTIFGAVFESTLNPETRRSGGMHYTSIENIHKVIDPLFLDDLKLELDEILHEPVLRTRERKLKAYQEKLAEVVCLDPAAGSGNFLTESYLSLRRLENRVLGELSHGQMAMAVESMNPIKVSIGQFYGIEINDFAVTVARTALWIAENQMLQETESLLLMHIDFLPLKSYPNIREGNALRMDWEEVVNKDRVKFIMGNPPFVGHNTRTDSQKEDMTIVFGKGETESKLDYVICWYQKAAEFIKTKNEDITTAFVSTNSICQGESVPAFWKQFVIDHNIEIQYAYSPFIWDSEASAKAHVHCVIVGFSNAHSRKLKKIYTGTTVTDVEHINPYLIAAPDVWLENRTNKPQNGLPKMTTGSQPMDFGKLILTSDERDMIISKYPVLEKYIRPFIGAQEFLHDAIGHHSRYCFWFCDGDLSEIKSIKEVHERIDNIRELRKESKIDRVRKKADVPYLFCQIRQPESTYLVIPRHSSQSRTYIPIGFMSPDIIAGDACTIIPSLGLYEFGVLTSNIHMAWVRTVCGRIKSDFRYQASVYNNFPWPDVSDGIKHKIEMTAQGILDARAKYDSSCLADLYDPSFMPVDLRKAHIANDIAVMDAYGFKGTPAYSSEAACVAALMKMYQEKAAEK